MWIRYFERWFGSASKQYSCLRKERGRGEYKLCRRPDLPIYVMHYEDLFLNPTLYIDDFLNHTGIKLKHKSRFQGNKL